MTTKRVAPLPRASLERLSELAAALAGLNSLLHENATAAADPDALTQPLNAYHAGAVHHAAELLALELCRRLEALEDAAAVRRFDGLLRKADRIAAAPRA